MHHQSYLHSELHVFILFHWSTMKIETSGCELIIFGETPHTAKGLMVCHQSSNQTAQTWLGVEVCYPIRWSWDVFKKSTPQKFNHGIWKEVRGKGDSFWKPSFSGSMLNYGGVSWKAAKKKWWEIKDSKQKLPRGLGWCILAKNPTELGDTGWWFRNPKQPPGMWCKPCN